MARIKRAMTVDINEVERYYTITEDGMVWTKIKNRWLKPRQNMYGYIFYSISRGTGSDYPIGAFAHTLVALKYIGRPPTGGHEIDHINDDKTNNHYSNLRWVTHSENQMKALSKANGKVSYWLGRQRNSPALETRIKMSNAKKKPIRYIVDGVETVFDSIEDASVGLGTGRKRIYLCVKNGLPYKGGMLTEIRESLE